MHRDRSDFCQKLARADLGCTHPLLSAECGVRGAGSHGERWTDTPVLVRLYWCVNERLADVFDHDTAALQELRWLSVRFTPPPATVRVTGWPCIVGAGKLQRRPSPAQQDSISRQGAFAGVWNAAGKSARVHRSSDAFKAEPVEEAPGIIKVQSRNMTEGGEEINTGGNASAEGGAEELDDTVKIVDAIEHTFHLQEYEMSATALKTYLKSYYQAMRKAKKDKDKGTEELVQPLQAEIKSLNEMLAQKNNALRESASEVEALQRDVAALAAKIPKPGEVKVETVIEYREPPKPEMADAETEPEEAWPSEPEEASRSEPGAAWPSGPAEAWP